MKNSTKALMLLFWAVGSGLAGCQPPLSISSYPQAQRLADEYTKQYKPNQKTKAWYGPAPAMPSPLRRIHSQQPAILVGHVVRLDPDGTTVPQPGASIILKYKELAATDETGTYVLPLPPGRHVITAGAIGFLKSKPTAIEVRAGDSIRLDFRLLPDLRPIIHAMP